MFTNGLSEPSESVTWTYTDIRKLTPHPVLHHLSNLVARAIVGVEGPGLNPKLAVNVKGRRIRIDSLNGKNVECLSGINALLVDEVRGLSCSRRNR